MNRIFITFFMIVIYTILIPAQNHVFTVFASKGSASVIKKAGIKAEKLSTGVKLFDGQSVVLKKGDYLALAHSSGATLELTSEGTFTVKELSEKAAKNQKSTAKKFTDYVLSEMVKSTSTSKEMKHVGAVERSVEGKLYLSFPIETKILQEGFVIQWYKHASTKLYSLSIINEKGKTVYNRSTGDTSISIDPMMMKLTSNKVYRVSVIDADSPSICSDEHTLVPVGAEILEQINLTKIELAINNGAETAMQKLIVASLYESFGVNYLALEYVKEACLREADVKEFQDYYLNFLRRINPAEVSLLK